jgi:hypothetical protein
MAEDNQLILDLSLGVDKLNTQIGTIQGQLSKAGEDSGDKFSKGFESSLGGIAKVVSAVIGGITAIGGALSLGKAISEASEAEQAINRLNTALASGGNFTSQASESMQNFADKLSLVSNFSDDAIISSAALIENMTKLDVATLQRATQSAADLAAGRQISLEAASDALAKAANGNVTALQKMGLEFSKNATDAQKLEQALAAIQGRFGGQALAQTYTYAGAITQLSNSFSNVFEELGTAIIKTPEFIAVIKAFTQVFVYLKEVVKENSKEISAFVSNAANGFLYLMNIARNVANFYYEMYASIFSFISGISNSSELDSLIAKLQFFGVVVLGYLIKGFNLVSENAKETAQIFINLFKPAVEFVGGALKTMFESISTYLSGDSSFASAIRENISAAEAEGQKAIQTSGSFISQMKSALTNEDTGEGPFDPLFKPFSAENVDKTLAELSRLGNGVSNTAAKIKEDTDKTVDAFTNLVKNGIAKGIGAATAAMTTAMMKGDNVLKAFAGSILATLGDLSIQMGQFLILAGLGMQALLSNPITASFATVAAGMALVALGTILKSFSQKPMIGGGDYSQSANTGIYNPNETLAGSPIGDREDQRRGTEVNVNVQGNVFNQRETGLEIARIIRDSFEQEGVTTVGAV